MDFSTVDLAEDQEFLDRARRFLVANVTDELLRREHETGDGFIEQLHLAMGADGWLEREAKSAKDGGLTLRDGDEWVINGQKMFTSGAHNCRYLFLLTNTDPNGRRHRNLTTTRDRPKRRRNCNSYSMVAM
jgi:alkylation response protein AidB-like acyl-CoA dehydrogenase